MIASERRAQRDMVEAAVEEKAAAMEEASIAMEAMKAARKDQDEAVKHVRLMKAILGGEMGRYHNPNPNPNPDEGASRRGDGTISRGLYRAAHSTLTVTLSLIRY